MSIMRFCDRIVDSFTTAYSTRYWFLKNRRYSEFDFEAQNFLELFNFRSLNFYKLIHLQLYLIVNNFTFYLRVNQRVNFQPERIDERTTAILRTFFGSLHNVCVFLASQKNLYLRQKEVVIDYGNKDTKW